MTTKDTDKYRRIRNNTNVRIAPCDMREKIREGGTKAEAKIVTSFDEVQDACKILEQKYSLMYKMT